MIYRMPLIQMIQQMKDAMSGYGKLAINHKINTMNKVLFDKYDIGRKDSLDDFLGYFFINRLQHKHAYFGD